MSGFWNVHAITLRPIGPIVDLIIDIQFQFPTIKSESLIAHLTGIKQWRSAIEQLEESSLPLIFDALAISVVQTVLLAVILGVVLDMARL